MMTFDLIITNCNIVTSQGVFKGTVSIDEGKIMAISSPTTVFDATKVIDAKDGYLLPGVIDPHVHFGHRPKGFVKNLEDDQESLVDGGVTSVLSFIGEQEQYSKFIPPIIDGIHQTSLIDVGIHTVINNREQLAGVNECAQKFGVTSIKFFIANRGGVQLYPSTWSVDDGTFYEGLGIVSRMGPPMLALAHCENWEIASMMADKLKAEGRSDQAAWSDSFRLAIRSGVDTTYTLDTQAAMVPYDPYPHGYVPFHGHTYEWCYGRLFFRQLQLRYNVRLDTVVGGADDAAGAGYPASASPFPRGRDR